MKTISLKEGMPTVDQALLRMNRELALARQQGFAVLKLIHGYGSSGVGGEIRIAAQLRLREMATRGEIRGCIFGENWTISDEQSWKLVRTYVDLKQDKDLGKKNLGITVVIL